MSEQPQGSSTGRWLKRITQSMSGEPRDLAELVEHLREASERGLFDGDALVMLEGVLAGGAQRGPPPHPPPPQRRLRRCAPTPPRSRRPPSPLHQNQTRHPP